MSVPVRGKSSNEQVSRDDHEMSVAEGGSPHPQTWDQAYCNSMPLGARRAYYGKVCTLISEAYLSGPYSLLS